MLQPEYIRIEHKTIQDPCTALKAIDTTLKKITTLEEAIKLEKHHDQWNPLYIGIGIGITVLSAIGIAASFLMAPLLTPGAVITLVMIIVATVSIIGIVFAPIATMVMASEMPNLKKTRQGRQKELQQMIDSVSGYNFSKLKKGFDTEFVKAQKDEHGMETVQRLRPLTKITATDYFNLFTRAETALAFN